METSYSWSRIVWKEFSLSWVKTFYGDHLEDWSPGLATQSGTWDVEQQQWGLIFFDINSHNMGLSENVGYIPNEIAIFHRDNDQQNHWV